MRVLVVEDDDTTREVLKQALKMMAHTPFLASDLSQAARIAHSVKPDVILLDLLLHREIGTPFIQMSREFYPTNPPKVIILSALSKVENIAKANKVDFLTKPFEIDELEKKLDQISLQKARKVG